MSLKRFIDTYNNYYDSRRLVSLDVLRTGFSLFLVYKYVMNIRW